jgi:hypothetical protein
VTQPGKCALGPLSFVDPNGCAVFWADDSDEPGHLNFKLSSGGELIGLYDSELQEIDAVIYGPQTTDVSQGRAPDGEPSVDFFELPTPGLANAVPGEVTVTTVTLFPESADKRAIVPLSADAVDDSWKSNVDFNDADWLVCTGAPGAIGYERSSGYQDMLSLDVESVIYGAQTSCYVRIPFEVDGGDLAALTGLVLKIRYDDAFVAYLNGVEVGRRNFTGAVQWNSDADSNHEADDADFDVYVDISAFLGELKAGTNLLAIQALNVSTSSSDFIISAELDGTITESISQDDPYAEAFTLLSGLRITEIMYHAPDGADYDYIELTNISDSPLDVNGVRFTEGIEFTFGPAILDAGRQIVVVSSVADFRDEYGTGINVAGEYLGNLSNGDDDIVLNLPVPFDAAILRFSYSDVWYPSTDGAGQSLMIKDANAHPATWNEKESWEAGTPTPGGD